MNIILMGYRCTGKTSVGKRLATCLNSAFYDTDALIQEETGKTIRQIVDEDGWRAFRTEEKKTIARLALQDNCVIALGGGAALDPENIEALKVNGRIIWMMANIETVLERMTKDATTDAQRPPLLGRNSAMEVILVLEERTPVYEAAADAALDTDERSIDELVDKLMHIVRTLNPIPLPTSPLKVEGPTATGVKGTCTTETSVTIPPLQGEG
ncbi:MAG: Shikimate kinase [Syntrophus sp. SKADARSKE-3]|nr:Shikimate kinase [Syntrophus sp. SKADARSKE-3]